MAKFEPREHLINIRNGKSTSEYLEVKWRLVWYRAECPEGEIRTEVILLDLDKEVQVEAFVYNTEKKRSEKVMKTAKGVAVFRATVTDGKGASATGTKSENAANFPDFIEKAESGAIGRALAALGYGTQFTGDELDEKERIVDSPVDRHSAPPAPVNHRAPSNNGVNVPSPQPAPTSSISAPVPSKLMKRCAEVLGPGKWDAVMQRVLGKVVPEDNLTPEDCTKLNQAIENVVSRRQPPPQQQAS